jgi:hypothetical protein
MIDFKFIVGGGPFLTFDYHVIGGPDDGRRITTLPERDRVEDGLEYFNGTGKEYAELYGANRPRWRPHSWYQGFLDETIKAASDQFGSLCPVYYDWYLEHVVEEHQNVINKVFDTNHHDTRYAAGAAALYAAMIVEMRDLEDLTQDDLEKAANRFVDEAIEWHERKRHDFEPHPHFLGRILEIARNSPKGMYNS